MSLIVDSYTPPLSAAVPIQQPCESHLGLPIEIERHLAQHICADILRGDDIGRVAQLGEFLEGVLAGGAAAAGTTSSA